jgi:predicted  nucleic acid-binding Zn-ribbon protein
MELTQAHIGTIERTAAVVAGIAEDVKALKQDVETVRQTQDSHTTSLDAITKSVKDWNTEIVAVRARLDRHDQWFKQISDHLSLNLDS